VSSETVAVVRPCTYPARPISGGPLERALPKPGDWCYEPKYNGWRALVHAPTGTMFNRHGQPLNIAALFGSALKHLRTVRLLIDGVPVEWFDCEALCRLRTAAVARRALRRAHWTRTNRPSRALWGAEAIKYPLALPFLRGTGGQADHRPVSRPTPFARGRVRRLGQTPLGLLKPRRKQKAGCAK